MGNDSTEYVWYASFGSNLCEKRFLCYIQGGKPESSTKSEIGCRDKTLPLQTRAINLEFPLYFSKHSKRWGGGAAFIGTTKDISASTLARMYLIKKEQFIDVVEQENGSLDTDIDLLEVIEKGSKVVQKTRYGNILHAGNCDNHPIFTFTHYLDIDEMAFTVPSKGYLSMLISGYKEAYPMSNEEIAEYLVTKPGATSYTKEELLEIIEDV